jgi:DNA helicase-2/ATP-dependent DNA helicase PcrA
MSFLNALNEAQRQAVVHTEGPMMVIAGAGSGKTRVLAYRIAYMIQQGVDPFQILALTFTNKAAAEMKSRIASLVGDEHSRNIWMGTFHSIFARILRTEADRIHYPRTFTIYDTQDSRSLLKDVIKELGLDDKIYKPSLIHHRISSCKNNLIGPADYAENIDLISEDRQSGKTQILEIYKRYDLRMFKAGAMDFDDLLFKTNVLFRDHPDLLVKYQHKFRYILVDEYQDTNFSQYLIVKQLGKAHENVCVVGDDAQSIYSFRGANIQNILNFRRDYPDHMVFKLEQNYRSTQTIVNAANGIIAKNKDRLEKHVWTANGQGSPIILHQSLTDNEEGGFVAHQIFTTKKEEGSSYAEFAILYRTNAQSRSFEEAFRKLNIPYKIYGGTSFYQRKEIKDLLAYFRLTANPKDEESLKRVINYPVRGIGKTTLDKIAIAANERGVSMWEILEKPDGMGLNSGTLHKLDEFLTMIKSFRLNFDTTPAYDIAHKIASSCGLLQELYLDKTPEGVARYENIQELLNGIKEFTDKQDALEPDKVMNLSDFLIDVALLTDADNEDDNDKDKVSLMTIHASKGLEYPYINIVGLEENLFPSMMALNSREELEEERRLFYVALTRAEKRVTLSYANTRYRWGQLTYAEPSRFIEEVDEQYILKTTPAPSSKSTSQKQSWIDFESERKGFSRGFKEQPSSYPSPKGTEINKPFQAKPTAPPPSIQEKLASGNFKKVNTRSAAPAEDKPILQLSSGQTVMHEKFGKGKVLKVEGEGADAKATIFFPQEGQKQILLKFAKLTVLD